jgi:hypothetical protein
MIVELQREIELRVRSGARFEEIEERVIDPAPLNDDQKAALWLFAWSLMPERCQRAEAAARFAFVGS